MPHRKSRGKIAAILAGALALGASARAETQYRTADDFASWATQLREDALRRVEPQVVIPTTSTRSQSRYRWKENIVTTVFWIGENATPPFNPVCNRKSSWDPNWSRNYGGVDDPNPGNRRGYLPKAFVPRLNPFYIALPYNDVTKGHTKPEAKAVIPWFRRAFQRDGHSVCKGRWVAIRNGSRVCYAQWEDCGPFLTDHWQYVFATARPKPNLNKGAGLDISPAVRDYLQMGQRGVTDWRFVEVWEVPSGPWRLHGENNDFVIARRKTETDLARNDPAARSSAAPRK